MLDRVRSMRLTSEALSPAGVGKVLVAVEDRGAPGFGRIRLSRVKDASGDSLIGFIKENVETGSSVRTDGWNGYNDLKGEGQEHVVQERSGEVGEEMLPLVHRCNK